jgi:hypothetical protein
MTREKLNDRKKAALNRRALLAEARMKQEEKADLNRRALLALGWTVEDDQIWTDPNGYDLYYAKGYGPDLIGNPDGTGGCWGQVMVANRLTITWVDANGGFWRWCAMPGHSGVDVVDGASPGEAVARWCVWAEEAGLKPKWTGASADCGFVDPLRRTE